MKLLVGTTKGLVVFEEIDGKWSVKDQHFLGMPVSTIYVDERNKTWWASLAHRHWGQKLHYSEDEGKTWPPVAPLNTLQAVYSHPESRQNSRKSGPFRPMERKEAGESMWEQNPEGFFIKQIFPHLLNW